MEGGKWILWRSAFATCSAPAISDARCEPLNTEDRLTTRSLLSPLTRGVLFP